MYCEATSRKIREEDTEERRKAKMCSGTQQMHTDWMSKHRAE